MKTVLTLLTISLTLAGCASPNYLDQRYNLPRADLKEEPIEATHNPAPTTVGEMSNPDPTGQVPPSGPGVLDVITGTWDFTTPPTVTRNHQKSADLDQFSVYDGRPNPTDKPFVVITVTPPEGDKGSQAEADGGKFKVANTRTYTLNGNIAKEWTGRTSEGAAFCELIITKPGGAGDICHAIAIARTEAQRKVSLDILASIRWKPTTTPTTPTTPGATP